MAVTRKYGSAIAAPVRIGNQPFAEGEANHAKRQKPKKYTRAKLKAIRQTRIKNLRSKKCQEN
jgi:hypothetical protein